MGRVAPWGLYPGGSSRGFPPPSFLPTPVLSPRSQARGTQLASLHWDLWHQESESASPELFLCLVTVTQKLTVCPLAQPGQGDS